MMTSPGIKDVWKAILGTCFVVTLVLNQSYGSFVYAKLTGQERGYEVGRACALDRISCENVYFNEDVDKIIALLNEKRDFFSDIFIEEARFNYIGNCPCPYDSDSRGGSCGERSSYSNSGMISYCYDSDVSDEQIAYMRVKMVANIRKSIDDEVQMNVAIYEEKYTLALIIIFYSGLYLYFRKEKQ